jgi:uncharacterized protein
MKFLEMAYLVLTESKEPMSASEIWNFAKEKGYTSQLKTKGSTPEFTLSSRLYSSVGDPQNGKFGAVGERPKRFYIIGQTPQASLIKSITEETTNTTAVSNIVLFKERDLHCVLTYFIRTFMDAFPKTINHSTSKRKEFGEWVHPDMVACYYPRHHWKTNMYELSELLGDAQLGFYSFEIKQTLSFANLRESFFQAVSNSSWAHEGYLVTAGISMDHDFYQELIRLSGAFGIGIILLDLEDPDNCEILFDAEQKDHIDWDTVHKLCSMNKDFEDFVERVKKDVKSKEIREHWYDELLDADIIIKKFAQSSKTTKAG